MLQRSVYTANQQHTQQYLQFGVLALLKPTKITLNNRSDYLQTNKDQEQYQTFWQPLDPDPTWAKFTSFLRLI